jgi:hypothetical protein
MTEQDRQSIPVENKGQSPADNPKGGSPAPTPVVNPHQPPVADTPAGNSNQNEDKPYQLAHKTYRLQIAFLLCQIILGIIAIWTLVTYHGQLVDMDRQLDKTQQQMGDSRIFFQTDERAWVELVRPKPVRDNRNPAFRPGLRYDLFFHNSGKTPALNIEAAVITIRDAPESDPDALERIQRLQDFYLVRKNQRKSVQDGLTLFANTQPVLAPGVDTVTAIPQWASYQSKLPSQKDWPAYIIGRVDYVDVFKVRHWMKFCFYLADTKGTLWYCKHGNDEDRTTETPEQSAGK